MYGQHPIADVSRFLRAVVTNQVAYLSPQFYVKWVGETGRGSQEESVEQAVNYFKTCFFDYFDILGINKDCIESYLLGKRILEYGPGDLPGVGLLMLAYGAESVICVDRFSLCSFSSKNIEILKNILDDLPNKMRLRAESCFVEHGNVTAGFDDQRLRYLVHPFGLSGLKQVADLIISRAVLEHVNDLTATFADMFHALRHGGMAVHEVDLSSHGLHRQNPLDFLTWPQCLWTWMYSHKGCVNRWRVDRYREAIRENGMEVVMMKPLRVIEKHVVEEVRPYLPPLFHHISDEELTWLTFRFICRKIEPTRV